MQGSRFKGQGSGFKVQGARFKGQGSRGKVRGSRVNGQQAWGNRPGVTGMQQAVQCVTECDAVGLQNFWAPRVIVQSRD
jgi:hypothetical protein